MSNWWGRVQKRLEDSPYSVRLLLVGLSYYLGARIGLHLSFHPSNIGALWPPNAVLLTALLLQPRRQWWGYLLVVIPAELAADLPAGITLNQVAVFLLADYAEVLTAALLVGLVAARRVEFRRLTETGAFIACAVIAAPLVAAIPGAAVGGAGPHRPGLLDSSADLVSERFSHAFDDDTALTVAFRSPTPGRANRDSVHCDC